MARFLLKTALLAALVLPLQLLIGSRLNRRPFERRDGIEKDFAEHVSILHFGDSVARHVAAADRDRRTLPAMLQDRMGDVRIGTSQGDGSSMELYEAFVRYVAGREGRPARVLIPINLRSLSQEFDPRPEYQFRSDRLRLRFGDEVALGLEKPLSLWKIYPLNPRSREQYLSLPVEVDGQQVASVRDLLTGNRSIPGREQVPSQFAFRYQYSLTPEHPKIRAMERIVEVCRGAGMEPLFYIYPIDVESGEGLLGPSFRERVEKNVSTIRGRMEARRTKMLDLSRELGSSHFDWKPGFPNEHLSETGRQRVADALAQFLRR
jgi:hypothetical protein